MQRTALGGSKNKDQAHKHSTGEIALEREVMPRKTGDWTETMTSVSAGTAQLQLQRAEHSVIHKHQVPDSGLEGHAP